MFAPLIAKLERGCSLSGDDRRKLIELTATSRIVKSKRDIISESEPPSDVHLVTEGFACRYKVLPSGRRQIMALLLPGDFCDLHIAILGAMDHSIGTITDCEIVDIPRESIDDLTENYPGITRALWWATLVDEAVLREWLVNMGGRSAEQQLAHFICEMLIRMQVTGRGGCQSFDLPMTQEDLADTLGMSVVHINRSLQKLRSDGLIIFKSQRMQVLNRDELQRRGEFDPLYLHLRSSRARTVTK